MPCAIFSDRNREYRVSWPDNLAPWIRGLMVSGRAAAEGNVVPSPIENRADVRLEVAPVGWQVVLRIGTPMDAVSACS